MKVLLTGATGFVGSWVARELVAAGHEVRALVRATSKLDNLRDLAVEHATGDVLDAAAVRAALAGCDACVHTAGIAHFASGDPEHMYDVNTGGVSIVLGEAKRAGVTRAVLTSSTAAMGGVRDPVVRDETAPSAAEGSGIHYFQSKWRGEVAGLALADEHFAVCAVRPVVAYGPGDIYNSSASTALAFARRQHPVVTRGGASFCDVRDVARAHVAALERGRSGEVYLLGGHNMEILEMGTRVARLAGVKPPVKVPYAAAWTVAALSELYGRVVRRDVDLNRQLVHASSLYTWVSSEKATRELGYSIRPFDESVKDTLRFFIGVGRLRPSTPELRALA